MLSKLSLAGAAFAVAASALVPATAADAQRYGRGYRDGYYGDRYYDNGRRYYRGDRGHYRNRCKSGTTGAIVGAIAGGLLGRTIDTHGDRSLGTLGGAVGGGLAGRAIERSDNRGYCR